MIPPAVLWPCTARDDAAAAVSRASHLGDRIELDDMTVPYPALARELRAARSVVVATPDGLLALCRFGRRTAVALPTVGRRVRLPAATVVRAVAAAVEASVVPQVQALPDSTREPLLGALLVDRRVDAGWRIRPSPGSGWRTLARPAHLGRWLGLVFVSHAGLYAAFLALWAVVGGAAARGDLDRDVVVTATILLLLLAPLRVLAAWSAGVVTVEAGALLKRGLLGGILSLDPDQVRHRGAGQLLGLVLEAETLETLALTGAYAGLLAICELLAAALALLVGIRAWLLLGVLAVCLVLALALTRRYLRRRQAWSDTRLDLTHDLVERMVGHRTRLAYEGAKLFDLESHHDDLASYDRQAAAMDRAGVALQVLPRGWMVAALAVLLVPVPDGAQPARVAAALGGILLAFHGLQKLTDGLAQLADARVAWRRVGPIVQAAARTKPAPTPEAEDHGEVALRDVSFAHDGRPVLRDVSLAVHTGDRIVLQGPSGAGKSTLAAVMCGARNPTTGTAAGTATVTEVPQFHENHVLAGSFAFNLLLGRRWPPTHDDLRQALILCHELGLDRLLEEMPGGIEQPIGEVGWQLSHGERTRLYIARALLQKDAPVVILDESFAALDPEALQRTLACVVDRATTLIVIAHE